MDSLPPSEQPPCLALLTDFGLSDPFVGEMKGVIADLCPAATVIDHSHGIRPGQIREGAWVLARTYASFPPHTVHLAVVDPGVGGDRAGLVARIGARIFVAPDNGLLAPSLEAATAAGEDVEVRSLEWREIDRPRRGTTFDGRDWFAPAGARLAGGLSLAEVGPELDGWVTLDSFAPRAIPGGFEAEIIRTDRYGNLVSTVEERFLRREFGEDWREIEVLFGAYTAHGVRRAYEEVAPGEVLLTIGGSGTLEISVNSGSARKAWGASAGARFRFGPRA